MKHVEVTFKMTVHEHDEEWTEAVVNELLQTWAESLGEEVYECEAVIVE